MIPGVILVGSRVLLFSCWTCIRILLLEPIYDPMILGPVLSWNDPGLGPPVVSGPHLPASYSAPAPVRPASPLERHHWPFTLELESSNGSGAPDQQPMGASRTAAIKNYHQSWNGLRWQLVQSRIALIVGLENYSHLIFSLWYQHCTLESSTPTDAFLFLFSRNFSTH